jgi:hypothetical protein
MQDDYEIILRIEIILVKFIDDFNKGKFHNMGDAERIVIRGQLGHTDKPFGRTTPSRGG